MRLVMFAFFGVGLKTESVCSASVIHSDVSEQIGHGLSVVDAPDGLSQDHTDIHCFDFWTLQLLHIMRHSVGHDHLQV